MLRERVRRFEMTRSPWKWGLERRRGNRVAVLSWTILILAAVRSTPADQATTAPLQPDLDSHYRQTCIAAGCHPVRMGGILPKHLPYLEGQCLPCHRDHVSTGTALIKPLDDAMCFQCHTGLDLEKGGQQLKHPPDSGLCLDCHNPHESGVPELLREEKHLLGCARCHEPFLTQSAKLPFRHHYFEPQTQCGSCHYAHRRSSDHYLRENVGETCLTCHDIAIRLAGRTIENVAARLLSANMTHKAMDKGSCAACHTPHGSPQPSLLEPGYPPSNYAPYRRQEFALCWKCHDPSIVEAPLGEKATAFRNGDENLHWFHVANLKRGRACQICHDAHASQKPHLIRDMLRFAKWVTPFNYTATADGGVCVTPCHEEKQYSRLFAPGEAPPASGLPRPSPATSATSTFSTSPSAASGVPSLRGAALPRRGNPVPSPASR